MQTVYHYIGLIVFWLLIIPIIIYAIYENIPTPAENFLTMIKTLVTIWFIKDTESLERQRHFIITGIADETKNTFTYKVIVWCYNKRLKTKTP